MKAPVPEPEDDAYLRTASSSPLKCNSPSQVDSWFELYCHAPSVRATYLMNLGVAFQEDEGRPVIRILWLKTRNSKSKAYMADTAY